MHPLRGSFPLTWCWCCRVRVKKERKPAASTVRAVVLPGCGECAETVAAAVPGELSFSVTSGLTDQYYIRSKRQTPMIVVYVQEASRGHDDNVISTHI